MLQNLRAGVIYSEQIVDAHLILQVYYNFTGILKAVGPITLSFSY